MRAIVCGAGIAGLTTAWWLAHDGWDVLVVEQAHGPREQGYMIDFFGSGYDVAERMGILPRLRESAYEVHGVAWVDERGAIEATLEYDLFRRLNQGRLLSLMRGDLERVLLEALTGSATVKFGCTVDTIRAFESEVDLTLSTGEREIADLLVGADGIHSQARALVFGPEENYLRFLGYHTAACIFADAAIERALAGRVMMLSAPGREVGLYALRSGKIASFFVHATADPRLPAAPLETLKHVYGDLGWLVPETLSGAERGGGLYYDQVAQIEMDKWRVGRAVLVGDAAYAVSLLAGQGASLGMGGAYVLAEELRRAPTVDDGVARYSERLRMPILKKQAEGRRAAQWIAPLDRRHIVMRNWSLKLAKIPGLSLVLSPVLSGAKSVVGER